LVRMEVGLIKGGEAHTFFKIIKMEFIPFSGTSSSTHL
jgi:hypothetical protein